MNSGTFYSNDYFTEHILRDPLSYDTRSLDNFIRLLFIFVPYYSYTFHRILSAFLRFSRILYILHLYVSLTRNIFPIPDDAVDRRKLGSQFLILTVILGLIRTFIFSLVYVYVFQNVAYFLRNIVPFKSSLS